MKPTIPGTSTVALTSWGTKCIGIVLTFLVALVVALTLGAGIANAATFNVSNTNNGGAGSLRQAIVDANASPNAGGADRIEFNIPANDPRCGAGNGVCTISPTSQLPDITGAVVVDGYTQNGASPSTLATGSNAQLKVRLNGSVAGSGADGITITGPSSVVKGLVINGWGGTGVQVDATGVSNNRIQGNYIGTDSSGTQDVRNEAGVAITGGTNTLVGGLSTGARNVISGNVFGVIVSDGEASRIERNYIGTDASGTRDLGNDSYGVVIDEAQDNVIGGTSAAARNVISGNGDSGIILLFAETSGNRVEGNYIGTNASGTQDLGNDDNGVEISGATNTVVGGPVTGARNVISGNGDAGVAIVPPIEGDSGGSNNRLEGNYIGTNASGTADIGNGLGGVFIEDVANNVVGGDSAAAANLISNNGGDGVEVVGNLATGNRILRNSIFDNDRLGIDLDGGNQNPNGVTANDPQDPDTGENLLQNYPTITSAGQSTIQGTLNSNPNNTFTIRFYSSPTADPSGFGEGKTYLGQRNVSTNASGNASFTLTTNTPLALGQVVTATATNRATGDTSEFSRAVEVEDNTPPTVVSTNPQDGATGVPAAINVTAIFSEPMDASTINSTTFKLFKKVGTTNQRVPATVTYSPSSKRATLNPDALLDRGATYLAQVTTGAKDEAGNPLAQRKDFTFTINP